MPPVVPFVQLHAAAADVAPHGHRPRPLEEARAAPGAAAGRHQLLKCAGRKVDVAQHLRGRRRRRRRLVGHAERRVADLELGHAQRTRPAPWRTSGLHGADCCCGCRCGCGPLGFEGAAGVLTKWNGWRCWSTMSMMTVATMTAAAATPTTGACLRPHNITRLAHNPHKWVTGAAALAFPHEPNGNTHARTLTTISITTTTLAHDSLTI